MRYLALATDYDGTIASDGRVHKETIEALEVTKRSGRKLILATGRELDDLMSIFSAYDMFDLIVAENGAVIYEPATKQESVLCQPAQELIDALRERNVQPLSVGKGIIATWEPNDAIVLQCIKDLGLELQIIFNKGAVMILPPGVNKGSGLAAALNMLKLSPHNVVGVGDAENDHAFLSMCEFSVAVQNALPALKERADLVTDKKRGAGVAELIEMMVKTDLIELSPKRHFVPAGQTEDGSKQLIDPYNTGILISGISGGGKSSTTLGILENLCKANYQFCLFDPEGDYDSFHNAIVIGDVKRPPTVDEVLQLMDNPNQSVIVNLLGVPLADRPAFFTALLPRLIELRVALGRPHWIVVDEAHHLFPAEWKKMSRLAPDNLRSILMITVHPERITPDAVASIDLLIAVGQQPEKTVKALAKQAGLEAPNVPKVAQLEKGTGLLWFVHSQDSPSVVKLERAEIEKVRHRRKYAEGQLGPERSFYFRGPERKLNLRVQNLTLFGQIAQGVDDETWNYHLCHHDYSKWFKEIIKDDDLSDEVLMVEHRKNISPRESRQLIQSAIEKRYTLPV